MSVVKSKRGESELQVVTKSIALASYTIHICSNEKNFPKRYRWCLTGKIVEHTIEICNKERLGIKQYIRYMDDFILIHPDKEYLKYCLDEINKHVTGLNLKLSEKKTQIFPLKQGISFLGFRFYLTETGKVIRKLTKENVCHEKKKLRKMKKLVDDGVMTKENVDECYMSWKAHAKQGNTHNLILSMDKFYKNLWRGDTDDV